jgi:uncharacterized metal-binding protein
MAALEAIRRLGSDVVGICSLPALLNKVPRQSSLVKKIERVIVVDGCHNRCAIQLVQGVGIRPVGYVNLERDLGLRKLGPFTSLEFTGQEVNRVAEAIVAAIRLAEQGVVQDLGS